MTTTAGSFDVVTSRGGHTASFAALLRRHRLDAGLTHEALAERSGLSRRGIGDLERGTRRAPYRDTVERLAVGLDLPWAQRSTFLSAGERARSQQACRVARAVLTPPRVA